MEFISSEGLTRQHPRTLRALSLSAEERPLAIQIYGADPARMAASARIVEDLGADVCDINMGCPARRVVRAAPALPWLPTSSKHAPVICAVRQAVTIPLTVKLRLGLSADRHTYIELGACVRTLGSMR